MKGDALNLVASAGLATSTAGAQVARMPEQTFRAGLRLELCARAGNSADQHEAGFIAERLNELLVSEVTRTNRTFHTEDIFLLAVLESQACKVSTNRAALDRVAEYVVACVDALQQPNGLFHHAPSSPVCWSRANGWAAAGLSEMLAALPGEHPARVRITQSYERLMAGLRELQSTNGFWCQVLDVGDSYEESSGTGLIAGAMMRGVRNGWLEHDPYDEVARRGWIALTRVVGKSGTVYRSAVDCEPPGDSGQYLNAPVQNGEFIGQACALWCVNQFLESSERTESPDPPTARIH